MKRFLTMHPSHYSWAIGLVLIASLGQAQDCNNPVPVCGDVPEAVSLNYAQNIEFGCLNSPYVTVLEFMTNGNELLPSKPAGMYFKYVRVSPSYSSCSDVSS